MQTSAVNKNVGKNGSFNKLISGALEALDQSSGSWLLLGSLSQTLGVGENYREVINSLGCGIKRVWVKFRCHR